MTTNILFILGSVRDTSFNKQLAKETEKLIGDRANVSFLDYKEIPFMNQDLEEDPPTYVKKVKEEVKKSDAIWIFTPEYNGMIPGVLKNLLDWLSRPMIKGDFSSGTPVKGKPVTFSGAGGSNKTAGSRGQLTTLLSRIGMKVMDDPSCGFQVPPQMMKADHWDITEDDKKRLENQIDEFLTFIKKN